MPTVTFRNRDGKLVDVPTVTASRLKNEFALHQDFDIIPTEAR